MEKIIVEVGSTCTKIDKFNGNNIEKLEGVTIQFKKHYNEDKCLRESDVKELIKSVNVLTEPPAYTGGSVSVLNINFIISF